MKARSRSSSIPKKRSSRTTRQKPPKERWTLTRALRELESLGDKRHLSGMKHFGINTKVAYGISVPKLYHLARRMGKDHELALELWNCNVHEAKHLAAMIAKPQKVTAAMMERWVRGFDSWDVCDGTCSNLFAFTGHAWEKAVAWSARTKEFEKRAGFSLMAYLAYRDKTAPDAKYQKLLPLIRREAHDERNFVKKAVNWALRQIGKRNLKLNAMAIQEAEQIRKLDSRSARWIAADALRELKSDAVQARLRRKADSQ